MYVFKSWIPSPDCVQSQWLTPSLLTTLHTEAENNTCANEWRAVHKWQLYLFQDFQSSSSLVTDTFSAVTGLYRWFMDDVILPLTTDRYFLDGCTNRSQKFMGQQCDSYSFGCMWSHLVALVLSKNNARSSACRGEGGHRRSGSSQKDLITSFYGRGKCVSSSADLSVLLDETDLHIWPVSFLQ